MGHRGKDMTSTKAVMASLKCFPSSSSKGKGRRVQVHQECLQDRWETIQSIGQQLPALLLTPGPLSGGRGRPPISLQTKTFLLPAEPRKTDVTRIADLPPSPEVSYDEYDADDESEDSSDLGGAEGKPPVSLKQT